MIIKNITSNISSFLVGGTKRKTIVVKKTLKNTQTNNGVVNIHRYDKINVGDYYCAPHHYFENLSNTHLDISGIRSIRKKTTDNWIKEVSNKSLIIGGGGLMNLRHFHMQMKLFGELCSKGKKTVIWGAGHNDIYNKKPSSYNVDIDKFGLVGTRDYSIGENWVPCVSCLHPIFDINHNVEQEIGIIFGKKTIKNNKTLLKKLKNYPSTSNITSLEEIVSFIGKTNTIITDSYHAMYWSFLLGKKVLAVPTTSKFYDFKHKPVITTYNDFENDISKAVSYSGLLEECREINLKFADKTFNYLNIS